MLTKLWRKDEISENFNTEITTITKKIRAEKQ